MVEVNNATIKDAKQTVEHLKQIELMTKLNSNKIDEFLTQLEIKSEKILNDTKGIIEKEIENMRSKIENAIDLSKIELHSQILHEIHSSIGKILVKKNNDTEDAL